MSMITCRNLSFAYEGNTVVKGLNFTVNEGDYLCILGENGSGKSTLMKGILHLIKPNNGEIVMDSSLKSTEIGYLPQQTAPQKDFPASVYEVVLSGCLNNSGLFFKKSDKELAINNMKKLNIYDIKNKCYRELSGGQQQRVLLCRALCATKKLLLLDEPVSGLDPVVTQELYNLIQDINKNEKLTVIMISHDINTAVSYASHILHLKNEQAFFGTVENYKNTDIAKGFLGGDTLCSLS